MASQQYRPDIDGLRAIAVTLVLVYHAFPKAAPGGFVGVDVFFVISGFLITGIIEDQIAAGRFSIANFYQRRIRRIFPALIAVLAASFAAGWFWLLPDEFEQLGSNTLASSAFAANIALLFQSGYFDIEAAKKPLLHLWSLGIEEQFYIVWPLCLMAVARHRRVAISLIFIVGLISFALNLVLVQGHRDDAFYLPLTRAWELLTGAMLVFLKFRTRMRHDVTALLGLVMILVVTFELHTRSTFPGWRAAIPVAGAALLIMSPDAWFNRRVLASAPLVGIGLISYPLYLWHWPALVFSGVALDGLDNEGRGLVLGISVVLAWATYQLIEKPIRFGGHGPLKAISLAIAMIGTAGLGWWAYQGAGLPWRLPAPIRAVMDTRTEFEAWRVHECLLVPGDTEFKDCVDRDRRPLLLVWGDSTVGSLIPGLRELQQARAFGVAQFSISSCEPLLAGPIEPRCIDMNQKVLQQIVDVRPDIVMLEAIWYPAPDHIAALIDTINRLRAVSNARIVVMGRLPVWYGGLKYKMLHYYRLHFNELPDRLPISAEDTRFDIELRERLAPLGVTYISAENAFCDPQFNCTVRVMGKDGQMHITTSDGLHLTEAGSSFLIQKIKDQLLPPG